MKNKEISKKIYNQRVITKINNKIKRISTELNSFKGMKDIMFNIWKKYK